MLQQLERAGDMRLSRLHAALDLLWTHKLHSDSSSSTAGSSTAGSWGLLIQVRQEVVPHLQLHRRTAAHSQVGAPVSGCQVALCTSCVGGTCLPLL